MEKKVLKDAWKQGFFKFLGPDNKIATQRGVYLCPDDNRYYAVYNGLQINLKKSDNALYDFEYFDYNKELEIREPSFSSEQGSWLPKVSVEELKVEEKKEEEVISKPVEEVVEEKEFQTKRYVFKDAWKIGTFDIFFKSRLLKKAVYKDDEGDIYCTYDGNIALLEETINANYSYKLKEVIVIKEKKKGEEKKEIDAFEGLIDENCICKGKIGENVRTFIDELLSHEVYKYYPEKRKEEEKRVYGILVEIFEENVNFNFNPLRGMAEDLIEIAFINLKTLYAYCYNHTLGKNVKISLSFDDFVEIVRTVVKYNKKFNHKYFVDYPFKDRPVLVTPVGAK